MTSARITLFGGPTALIELDGFRLLTDPTFDPPGEYQLPHVRLTKTSHPALSTEEVGSIDAVLLSHDQHADNLDRSRRAFLVRAERAFATEAGAQRLGGHAEGLAPWTTKELAKTGSAFTTDHSDTGASRQQPPTAGADRQHSASRSGGELLRDPHGP